MMLKTNRERADQFAAMWYGRPQLTDLLYLGRG